MRTTLFVDELTVLDFAYVTPGLGVRGDSVYVGVELDGEPDDAGFIVDFGRVKKLVKRLIDEEIDHRLVVPRAGPDLAVKDGVLHVGLAGGELRYACPEQALAWIDGAAVTRATLVAALEARLMPHLPANVAALRVLLRDELRLASEPSFSYTHGLKHHDGNCQRLLHGHRNVIEARLDGRRDVRLELALVELFADKHFASRADVRGGLVSYRSAQGEFRAELPPERLVVLEREPSIEHIAAYAHAWLTRRFELAPQRLSVTAYEGLRKGATARA